MMPEWNASEGNNWPTSPPPCQTRTCVLIVAGSSSYERRVMAVIAKWIPIRCEGCKGAQRRAHGMCDGWVQQLHEKTCKTKVRTKKKMAARTWDVRQETG